MTGEAREALTVAVGQPLYQWAVGRTRIHQLTEYEVNRLHDACLLLVRVFLDHELPRVTEQDQRTREVAEAAYRVALAMWAAMGAGEEDNTDRVLREALDFALNGPDRQRPGYASPAAPVTPPEAAPHPQPSKENPR